ncbi:zinc finger domain-containing protein [Streptomyces mexicanus]|uniref:zinc finger domain-containing protein n=1 Tax=Streptomyces mexicanus TaxID=178566 RepID=UPI00364A6D4D
MTPAETAEVLGLCAAFDRRTIGKTDVIAWHGVLADIDLADAKRAVARHYATETRWLMPADIRQAVRKARADAAADYQGPGLPAEIPDADPDDVPAYLAALRAQRHRASDGLPVRRRPVGELVAHVARQLPAADSTALEETVTVRRPGPLGVDCPTCHAAIGRPCKRLSTGKPQKAIHHARRVLARGETPPDPEAAAAEEARRRAAAARLADAHEPAP